MSSIRLCVTIGIVFLLCGGAWGFDNCERYGVVDQWGTDGSGTDPMSVKLTALGATYIRSGWDWDLIERYGDNQYDQGYLDLMDNWATTMNNLGVHILYGFSYTPPWAAPDGIGHNTPPSDPTRYTDFITFMVNRYKDRIHDWGFWNEVNLDGFWNGSDTQYIHDLLIPGIAAVKAADPTARCIVGELASCCSEESILQMTLNEITAHGQKDNVDVVCVHAYGYGDTASGRLAHLDSLHNLIVNAGYGDKDFWCTETSFGGTEQNQSSQILAFMQGMDARRTWWKKTFYYTFGCAAADGGLLGCDLTERLAYFTYQSYIAAHSDDQWTYGNNGNLWFLPGTIQAENYDDGCEGVSYHDSDAVNSGGAFREEGVDIEACSEGGYDVGWLNAGEWTEYTVDVASTGIYDINVRVATPENNRAFHVEMNGQNVTGTKLFNSTGGYQNWGTVTCSNVSLSAGQQVMRLVAETNGWNVNDVEVVPGDVTAPGPVTGFTAVPGEMRNTLTWTNPGDADLAGVTVRFKTSGYPTSPTDGTQIYNGLGTSYAHTGLANGVTYYYSAWAYDEVPNYSAKADASATTTYCFEDMFSYANGNLNGNGGWTGSASSQIVVSSQTVMVNGGAGTVDAMRATSCGDPGLGYMIVRVKVKKGAGDATMWSLYIDDTSGLNLARWYGTGTTARGRIGVTADVTATQTLTGEWDDLKVKITPSANTSEFFFNGTSIGTLSHASQGAGDIVGRLRFERSDNSAAAGHYVYFDDLRIGQVDTVAPGSVTGFTATPGNSQNALAWTNPGDGDYAGTMIRFSTVGYPGGPTGGTLCYNGSGTSFAHTGLTNGVTYYYSAFAYDEVPNYAGPATTSGIPVVTFCFQDEFNYANGALVGQGGWTGNATVSHIEVVDAKVRIWGGATAYNALKTISCDSSPTGFIWVRLLAYPGTGTATMWNVWINDSAGKNFARWYGSGTTARGRIGTTSTVTTTQTLTGGGVWDSLVVKINPTANTTQFYFNGADLGTYSHGTQPNNVVSQINIQRENNSSAAGNNMYLDNIRVSPN